MTPQGSIGGSLFRDAAAFTGTGDPDTPASVRSSTKRWSPPPSSVCVSDSCRTTILGCTHRPYFIRLLISRTEVLEALLSDTRRTDLSCASALRHAVWACFHKQAGIPAWLHVCMLLCTVQFHMKISSREEFESQ